MRSKTFFINASNIHSGGGKVLLIDLLKELEGNNEVSTFVFVDSRFKTEFSFAKNIQFLFLKKGLLNRLSVDFKIKKKVQAGDTVLSIGNASPILSFKEYNSYLFLQNRLLVDKNSWKYLNFALKMRIYWEQIFLKFFNKNVTNIIVQTETMNCLTQKFGICKSRLRVIPYREKLGNLDKTIDRQKKAKSTSFIYIASEEFHKNHYSLMLAWELLAKQGIKPVLRLNVSKSFIKNLLRKDFYLENVEFLKIKRRDEIQDLYRRSDALVYPSFTESFGLPLLEAQDTGLAILASERVYVRDVVEPTETFDPESPLSIAQAVKRYLGYLNLQKIYTPKDFLEKLENPHSSSLLDTQAQS